MKFLELSGSHFEIGEQHGEQAKEEVHFSIDSYEKLFYENVNLSWEEAIEEAKKHLDFIEQTDPTFIQEMEGIAKGAGVDFHDILALNVRSEIALTKNETDGCTSVSILPPLATDAYLAQNWDWRAAQARSIIVTKITQKDRPTIQMVTEGGIIGKIGFNDHGLGVGLNAIRANVKSNKLPIHLGLRHILNASKIDEAVERVSNKKIASAANYIISQDDGENPPKTINMEVSPTGEDQKVTEDAYVVHTNHLCSNLLVNKIGEDRLATTESTYFRMNRIKELVKAQIESGEKVDGQVIKSWLSDHQNEPFTICIHEKPDESEYTNSVTVFSVIMNLTKRTMHFMNGNPCQPTLEKHLTL